jgi:hypothetical protein
MRGTSTGISSVGGGVFGCGLLRLLPGSADKDIRRVDEKKGEEIV